MTITLESPPTEEPVTSAEAKSYLKIDTSDEDDFIASLISVARIRAETYTGRAFITQTWNLWLNTIFVSKLIEIPLAPLQSVNSVLIYGDDDSSYPLDTNVYHCDTESVPGRIFFDKKIYWNGFRIRKNNAVKVVLSVGYGAAKDVPPPIKQAILAMVACFYSHRGDEAISTDNHALALLNPYRIITL